MDPTGLDCVYLFSSQGGAGGAGYAGTPWDAVTVQPGDCGENDEGYFVDGTVTGIVRNDLGQVTGVTLDGGLDAQPVGFDYNSGSSDDGDASFAFGGVGYIGGGGFGPTPEWMTNLDLRTRAFFSAPGMATGPGSCWATFTGPFKSLLKQPRKLRKALKNTLSRCQTL